MAVLVVISRVMMTVLKINLFKYKFIQTQPRSIKLVGCNIGAHSIGRGFGHKARHRFRASVTHRPTMELLSMD